MHASNVDTLAELAERDPHRAFILSQQIAAQWGDQLAREVPELLADVYDITTGRRIG